MVVSGLNIGQGNVNIDLTVKSIGELKSFNKFGKEMRVVNALVEDNDGEAINMTLWNEDIERVKEGCKIKITRGYVNEFNGEKQLTCGKFGKIEFLGQI